MHFLLSNNLKARNALKKSLQISPYYFGWILTLTCSCIINIHIFCKILNKQEIQYTVSPLCFLKTQVTYTKETCSTYFFCTQDLDKSSKVLLVVDKRNQSRVDQYLLCSRHLHFLEK